MRAQTAASPPPAELAIDDNSRLVREALAGERGAFDTLYKRYSRFVHGLLIASVDRDDVQDLVQDIFFRAFKQLHTLRDPAAFGGWIATITRNEARMHHRAARPTEELSATLSAPPRTDTLGTADVLRALRTLPERYREPLTLRLVEEMSGEEIAAHTGLSHGTVRVYLHHGIRLLREQLGDGDV